MKRIAFFAAAFLAASSAYAGDLYAMMADCNGCHGDATAGNYWPDNPSSLDAVYPDRLGAHGNHIDTIGAILYGFEQVKDIHPAGAGHIDDLDVTRVVQSHGTCQVRSRVSSVHTTEC